MTNTSDNGPGSLRAAIDAAGDNGTVRFDANLKGTILLTSGDLNINKNIMIRGTDQSKLLSAVRMVTKSILFRVLPFHSRISHFKKVKRKTPLSSIMKAH